MIRVRAWLRGLIRPRLESAWIDGFDYAWNLAEKRVGPIAYVDEPGQGYDANPYRATP